MIEWKSRPRSLSARSGGRVYARRYVPGHPLADASGMAYEHRLVVWDRGARLAPGKLGTHVHHRRGSSNADGNLDPLPALVHNALSLAKARRVRRRMIRRGK